MSYKPLDHKPNQHTTPRCYLKNFSDDGKTIYQKSKTVYVDAAKIEEELNVPVSVKKATTQKDFYTVDTGREPMLVETLIYDREIESYYTEVYSMLINPTAQDFNMERRMRLLMCLLSLHCRTPKQFGFFFDFVKPMVKDDLDLKNTMEDYKVAHLSDVLKKRH